MQACVRKYMSVKYNCKTKLNIVRNIPCGLNKSAKKKKKWPKLSFH